MAFSPREMRGVRQAVGANRRSLAGESDLPLRAGVHVRSGGQQIQKGDIR